MSQHSTPLLEKKFLVVRICHGLPWWVSSKESAAEAAEDRGLIPASGRSPGGGHDIPLQYSCLDNLMDRGAWWAAVHGVAKSWTYHAHMICQVMLWYQINTEISAA